MSSQVQTQTQDEIVKSFDVEKDDKHYRYEAIAIGDIENGYVKKARLAVRYYPMYPYGNFVEDVIVIEESDDASTITFKFYTVRDSYNGTGSDYHGSVTIDETVMGETPFFLWADTYEDIETPEDFENLVKRIDEFIKEYASCNIVP
jgi:hypothetical protein